MLSFCRGGYGFNLTKKNFYLSNAFIIGTGIQQQTYRYPLGKYYNLSLPLIGRVKSSVGYNGKILFTGLFVNADAIQSSIKILKTQQVQYSYGLYLGVRIVKFTKSKAQLKQEAKEKKIAEKEKRKKEKESKKKTKKR